MSNNITPEVDALQHTQEAITLLSDIYKKDTEIISALRDLKFARGRIIEVLREGTR